MSNSANLAHSYPSILRKKFDIIIPAFNEEKRIRPVLDDACKYISENDLPWRLIVAIEGHDRTVQIVQEFASRYLFLLYFASAGRGGKGAAVMKASSMVTADFVILMDADNSIRFEQIINNIHLIERFGVVILSRYHDNAAIPMFRKFISRGFNLLVRMTTGLKVKDTQSGYKIFRSKELLEALKKVGATNTFYDISLLYHLNKSGTEIMESQNYYVHDKGSKFNPFAEIFGQGISLMAFAIRHSRLYPYIPEFLISLYKKKFRWI